MNDNRLEFYVSKWVSLLPFVFFISSIVYFALSRAVSLIAMIAFAVVGMLFTSFFAKNKDQYWKAIQAGVLNPAVGVLATIFLVVGIFSKLMAVGQLAGGFVWLSSFMEINGALFCALTFVFAGLFAVSTGTSVGTMFTLVPVLYPAGVLLGADPLYLIGAIISGASFGDNLAPISDTTIISASSQTYTSKEGSADIGGVVKSRFKYAIITALMAFALFLILGGSDAAPVSAEILDKYMLKKGLFMLLPPIVVATLIINKKHMLTALSWGIIAGLAIGLAANIFTFADVISIDGRHPQGIIVDGVKSISNNIILFISVMGMYGILNKSGVIEDTLATVTAKAQSARNSEAVIFGFTSIITLLTAGVTTMTVAIVGPLANTIGQKNNLHPYRRANLVDATANTLGFFIPWAAPLHTLIAIITAMTATYPFLVIPEPTQFIGVTFYPLILWFVMLFAVITGFGRTYEQAPSLTAKDDKQPAALVEAY